MTGTRDLEARHVVLTGASGGIGRVVAAELAGRGARLTLVGRRSEPLEELAAHLPGQPHRPVAFDVTDEAAWRRLARGAGAGPVHGLVTAAAVLGPVGPPGAWEVEEFRRTVDINVVGTLLPVLALLDHLAAARGSVVTFSGGGATGAFPRYDAYAASKSAVARLTENLAAELAEPGVRVNAVAPGFVATDMHAGTLAAGPDRAGAGYFARTEEAVRTGGGDPPEPAAHLTAFLLSDRAEGITGRLLSARWDPWADPAFQDRLRAEPDLATIRRIDDQFFSARPRR